MTTAGCTAVPTFPQSTKYIINKRDKASDSLNPEPHEMYSRAEAE